MLLAIKMNDDELEVLKEFMRRTTLKGGEAPAYMSIMDKLNKPEVVKIQTEEIKKKKEAENNGTK